MHAGYDRMASDDETRVTAAAASAMVGGLILRSVSLAAGVSLAALVLAALLSIR